MFDETVREKIEPKYPYVKILVSRETILDDPIRVAKAAVRGMWKKKVADQEIKNFIAEWSRVRERDVIGILRKWVYIGVSTSPKVDDGGVIVQ